MNKLDWVRLKFCELVCLKRLRIFRDRPFNKIGISIGVTGHYSGNYGYNHFGVFQFNRRFVTIVFILPKPKFRFWFALSAPHWPIMASPYGYVMR